MKEILLFLNDNSGISALISAIAVGVALYFNIKTGSQYNKSLEPQLSMRGETYESTLYLLIQNMGHTAAQDIRVDIKSIEYNGSNTLMPDNLFSQEFDLYPKETIQGMVALSEESSQSGCLFPKLLVDVSYYIYGTKTRVKYTRTVTFSKVYDAKVFAEINMDLRNIESLVRANARAAVRIANYMDGEQVTIFDEKNICAGKTLKTDMCSGLESI